MALNDVQELDEELQDTGGEYTDIDFSRKLRQANNRLSTTVGRQFIEPKEIVFEDETEVNLDFPRLVSFDKVVDMNDNNEIIDDSNYTVDLDTGKITFDQAYVDDNFYKGLVLKFYYVPESFKDLELYFAQRNIQEMQSIQTTDEVNNTQTDRLNQRIEAVINRINSRNTTGTQRGDNQNVGSQRPRRFSTGD